MYQLMINRKNSKKGFTLVEVIVVLVILAILAAIMIPAMTGWIDKAKEKSVIVEARSALLAAQTVASEKYAGVAKGGGAAIQVTNTEINDIAHLTGTSSGVTCDANGQVTAMVYTNGKTATYTAGASTPWVVSG